MSSLRSEILMLSYCSTSCTILAFKRWSDWLVGTSSSYCNGGNFLDLDRYRIECEGFRVCVLIMVICSHRLENFCHSSNFLHLDRSCPPEKKHWHCCCCFALLDFFDSLSSSSTSFLASVASDCSQIITQYYHPSSLLMAKLGQKCDFGLHLSNHGKDWLS